MTEWHRAHTVGARHHDGRWERWLSAFGDPRGPALDDLPHVPAVGHVPALDGSHASALDRIGHELAGPTLEGDRAAACGLTPESCSPKVARDFTRTTLANWRLDSLYEDSAVVVSELVTNALRYGLRCGEPAWPFRLVLVRHQYHLVCMVTDPSDVAPTPLEPDYAAETGRGLHIIEAVSRAWGWTPLYYGRGKAVWAAFSLPTAAVRQF